MPIPVKRLFPNGNLQEAPIEAESLNEVGRKEPEGIYTIARTFHRTQAVLFDAHLDRLEQSARLEGIELSLDRVLLREALAQLLEDSGFPESRFRITIPKTHPDQIWLAVEPLKLVPSELKRQGVTVATCEITRPNPEAKSNLWVSLRDEAMKCLSGQTFEGIILSADGFLIEGFSSNFYAILDGTLHTAGQNILHGIARRIVLEVAKDIIPLKLLPIHKNQLGYLEETFLTSSSRGIVPIVQIDQAKIADGTPGPQTRQLSVAYDGWVEENIRPIAKAD